MLASSVRSGLVETYHEGAIAICSSDGSMIAWSGEVDRPFYLRSSAKPFQALASQELGAALTPIELALACASHRGHPAQVAVVEAMLRTAGLSEDSLKCPPDWPLVGPAARRLAAAGNTSPRRVWHNCSGKHSGFLRACVGAGLPTESYLDPAHPLQKRVVEVVSELGRHNAGPVGVDGCGAPVLRTTARAMATLFASLAGEPALKPVFAVMHRYSALVSGWGEGDTAIATSIHAAAKGGAQGCIGVALGSGLGVAVKAWDGSHDVAVIGAIAALDSIGALNDLARRRLAPVARPDVTGGEVTVGNLEPRVELSFS